jgi:hypothetical protein
MMDYRMDDWQTCTQNRTPLTNTDNILLVEAVHAYIHTHHLKFKKKQKRGVYIYRD